MARTIKMWGMVMTRKRGEGPAYDFLTKIFYFYERTAS
jgi:hypothetical protein